MRYRKHILENYLIHEPQLKDSDNMSTTNGYQTHYFPPSNMTHNV